MTKSLLEMANETGSGNATMRDVTLTEGTRRKKSSPGVAPSPSSRRSSCPLCVALCVSLFLLLPGVVAGGTATIAAGNAPVQDLAREVSSRGWIVYAAYTEKGDLDLFTARPDGSAVRDLTQTPEIDEFGARFSADGRRLLWRQVERGREINHDSWGSTGTLVISSVDGTKRRTMGGDGDFPWASWGPRGEEIACLYRKDQEIRILDAGSGAQLGEALPAEGIFQQLFWSPDGRHFAGTANISGRDWNIVVIDLENRGSRVISRSLNCTPDWFPDSSACLYSHRNPNINSDDRGERSNQVGETPGYSWTMLLRADREGKKRELLVAEQYRHLYFGALSPDGKYLIYARLARDNDLTGPLALVRVRDTPVIDSEWRELRRRYRSAGAGPVLKLDVPDGFEPHWTFAEIREPRPAGSGAQDQ